MLKKYAEAAAVFEEGLDQQNIRLMFSDKFSPIEETMRAAADEVSLVTSNDRGHPLFADTRVPDHNYPAWFCALHANSVHFFHGYAVKQVGQCS
jgi:hypothetical protein